MKHGVGLITVTKPTSSIAEQFRTIRTNIQFSSADRQLKTLVFTSADPSEGKSTISSNVAVTWADQGNKVLLIDGDLRRPTVARSFRVSNSHGLTTILTAKQANLGESIHEIVHQVFNVGVGKHTSLNQVIQVYEQIINRELQIIHKAERAGDIKYSYADITHLRQLGYQPHYDITTGLKLYWESLTD